MQTKLSAFISWFDAHGLFAASLFLLLFIPLFPKLPLLDAIPGYLVRVRLEDLLIGVVGVLWLFQVWRGKVVWFTSYTALIIAYAVVGLLSLLFGILISQTIPLQALHIGKSTLHYLRYLEYFSLFIFMYSGITNLKQAKKALIGLAIAVFLIFVYGLGQKYASWPVFSTMNREYSKGQSLTLSANARLHSTFGGHYDLAAFLVIVLPLLFSWLLATPSYKTKATLALLQLGGVWLLFEAASEISLISYPVGIGVVLFLHLKQKLGLMKTTLISSLLFGVAVIGLIGAISVLKPSILHKITNIFNPQSTAPHDVVTPGQETWSPNAQKYGLSIAIRLDALWPQAINGWVSNPWLGKGYATLNKQALQEFTDADSVDNNYLRVLGETGLLGFVTLSALIFLLIRSVTLISKPGLTAAVGIGFIAATFGLLVNASLIDVFTASKVAFTYWALAGLVIKMHVLTKPAEAQRIDEKRLLAFNNFFRKNWLFLVSMTLLILLSHKHPFSEQSLVKNVELAPNSLQSLVLTKCWQTTHQWQGCIESDSLGFAEKAYAVYLLPWFSVFKEPSIFYFANLVVVLIGITLIYKALQKLPVPQWFTLLSLFVLTTSPLVYELPSRPTIACFYLIIIGLVLHAVAALLKSKSVAPTYQHSAFWLLPVGYLAAVLFSSNVITTLLSNFRDSYRPWRYNAVWRANTFFANSTDGQFKPILITAINPDYFKLYGQNTYELQPLVRPGLLPVTTEPPIFITNADLNSDRLAGEIFENYKQSYGIHLNEIDCQHQCNYYRLYPEDSPLDAQPRTINSKQLQLTDNQPFKMLVVSQRFKQEDREVPINTLQAAATIKTIVKSSDPHLLFLLGDAVHKQEQVYDQQFKTIFATEAEFPITYISGNLDHSNVKILPSESGFFVNGNTAFISYNPEIDGSVGPKTKLFIFDALLQLEKHPEITQAVILTHRSNWLWGRPEYQRLSSTFLTSTLTEKDAFFVDELLPIMLKNQNIQWHVLSGDLQSDSKSMFVFQRDTDDKVIYAATSLHHTNSDTYLELSRSSSGELTLVGKSTDGIELNSSEYSLDTWVETTNTER